MKKNLFVEYKILDKRLGKTIDLPIYNSEKAAGLDLRSLEQESIILKPAVIHKIPTGVAIFLKDPDLVGLLMIRSGLSSKGLMLTNSVGVIDADYQGEILCSVINIGKDDIIINPGDRIAQLLILSVFHLNLQQVEDFSSNSQRGNSGFGSTGL